MIWWKPKIETMLKNSFACSHARLRIGRNFFIIIFTCKMSTSKRFLSFMNHFLLFSADHAILEKRRIILLHNMFKCFSWIVNSISCSVVDFSSYYVQRKTGCLVVWQSGKSLSLYRGVSYEVLSLQLNKDGCTLKMKFLLLYQQFLINWWDNYPDMLLIVMCLFP